MRAQLPAIVDAQEALLHAVDKDTDAFNDFMVALAMPKETAAEKQARTAAMQAGLKKATRVPFETMQLVDRVWQPLVELARVGQYSSRSDLEVGAKALEAGLYGAYRNVLINLKSIKDEAFSAEMTANADTIMERGRQKLAEIQEIVAARTGDVPSLKT